MSETNSFRIFLSTDMKELSLAPGEKLEFPFSISNRSSVHEQVRFSVDGIPLVWVSMEQSTIYLAPGEERNMSMVIQAPAAPDVQAGRYQLILRAASLLNPSPPTELACKLTVAAYEVKGRITVLMDATQFSVAPGETLSIPLVLINQGLTADVVTPKVANLPDAWSTQPHPAVRLQPEQSDETSLQIKPPRGPDTKAGRLPFEIQVYSQAAPDQVVTIRCTLTVAVYSEFTASIDPEEGLINSPAKVVINNQGNAQEGFTLDFSSTDDALVFEDVVESPPRSETVTTTDEKIEREQPKIGQPLRLPAGETGGWSFIARQAKRPLFGSLNSYPYKAMVTSGSQETQVVEASQTGKALLPMWVLAVAGGFLILLLLVVVFSFFRDGAGSIAPPTLVATSTQSTLDQRASLVDRNWYLVSFNADHSVAGSQEPYTRFNQDGTILGHSGCKPFTGNFSTNMNQLTVNSLNAAPDDCGDAALLPQEQAMLNILRKAQSYFIADTVMQIISPEGTLNYSLSPVNRPEEVIPPLAVINGPTQASVNELITLDGQASSGQSPIVRWQWDFGDRGRGEGPVVQHVYTNPGRYRVQMTVTDQSGLQDSESLDIEIVALSTPTSAPTVTSEPTATPLPPEQPSPTPQPEATPTTKPTEAPVLVPPQAGISAPREGFIGEPIMLDASQSKAGSSPIVSYTWNFGDGRTSGPSPDPQVSTIYEKSGVFDATILVTDQNGLSSKSTTSIRIDARLDTIVWTLNSLNNQALVPGTAITLQFLQGRLAGFSGCNTYSGSYTAMDNGDGTYSVSISNLQTSRLGCPPDIMNQESQFLAIFGSVNLATIQGNVLTLSSPQGILIYHEVGTPKP